MIISAIGISKALKNYHPKIFGSSEPFYFSQYCLFSDASEGNSKNCIYISKLSDLPHAKNLKASAYIVLGDIAYTASSFEGINVPIIFLDSSASPEEVFSLVLRRFFICNERYEKFRTNLMGLAANGTEINDILKFATDELGNPFVIFDPNYSVIAHSIPDDLDIPDARRVANNNHANVEIISRQSLEGVLDKMFGKYPEPVIVKMPNGYDEIAICLFHESDQPALLVFYNYMNEFSQGDIECLIFLAKLIENFFGKSDYLSVLGSPCDSVFKYLIDNDGPPPKQLLDSVNVSFPPQMKLMLVRRSDSIHNVPLKYAKNEINKMLKKSYCFIDSCYIYFLCKDSLLSKENNPTLFDSLNAFLSKNHLVAGISNPFTELSAFHSAMKEAVSSIELGQRTYDGVPTFFYVDYLIPHMLESINEKSNVLRFCHPAFMKLIEYDEKYNTQYSETLKAYLCFNGSMNKCAEYFSVHYNSIKYRMKVIQNICGVDLTDTKVFISFYLSYLMLDIYGNINFHNNTSD